jgi:hypothetical protein
VESQLPATPRVGKLESDLFPMRLAEYGLFDDVPAVVFTETSQRIRRNVEPVSRVFTRTPSDNLNRNVVTVIA